MSSRMSVFMKAPTNAGYIQAVIVAEELPFYKQLGFVDHIEKLEESGQKAKPEAKKEVAEEGSEYEKELREEIKALGGKPAGRSSIATLEKQLEELKGE